MDDICRHRKAELVEPGGKRRLAGDVHLSMLGETGDESAPSVRREPAFTDVVMCIPPDEPNDTEPVVGINAVRGEQGQVGFEFGVKVCEFVVEPG